MPDTITPTNLSDEALTRAVEGARAALLRRQRPDGHWVFELEADSTIPAEYVLLEHFLDRIDPDLENKIGVYLRAAQGEHGGWPLFHDGGLNLSCSVKAYYALRCIGDSADAPHMVRAREAILAAGGAERTNVFTRAQLALFGQVPWRAVPVMPLEIMHLPLWFPFHLSKVSYWSRTVIVPLLVLMALQPKARNPRGIGVRELFREDPSTVRDYIRGPYKSAWGRFFKALDTSLRVARPWFPAKPRQAAINKCVEFVKQRLNGDDGLGGIYPAIANSVMMFDTLGMGDTKEAATAWQAVRKLLVVEPDRAYCQPCLSPIWDTGLAAHAVFEACELGPVEQACAWLRERQVTEVPGDWAVRRPDLRPGGWAFQVPGTTTTRTWTTQRWLGCCCTASAIRPTTSRSPERANGSWACNRRVAGGSMAAGGVRAGEHASASEPYSVCRSWRAARSADIGCDGSVRVVPGTDRHGRRRSGDAARFGVSAARAGDGGKLVRAVGDELYLWHVVRAVRTECGGRAGG